jgi:hypothetical protein
VPFTQLVALKNFASLAIVANIYEKLKKKPYTDTIPLENARETNKKWLFFFFLGIESTDIPCQNMCPTVRFPANMLTFLRYYGRRSFNEFGMIMAKII